MIEREVREGNEVASLKSRLKSLGRGFNIDKCRRLGKEVVAGKRRL